MRQSIEFTVSHPPQEKALISVIDTPRLAFHNMKQAQLDKSFNSESKKVQYNAIGLRNILLSTACIDVNDTDNKKCHKARSLK